ncbi:urate oxidase [Acidobacteria bacterium AB60]|nr:urate oxidase [Acidobacteria bacterium AB60]
MARLGENRYGKARVRLSRITRESGRHIFQEWTVRVLLQGDFEFSFTRADNSQVLPTDTMKNTVYALARNSKASTIEDFAIEVGDYLLANNSPATSVSVEVSERAWASIAIEGRQDPYTFRLNGPELQTAKVICARGASPSVTSGIEGLTILKTTRSGFEGFFRDKLTTLKPASDRIFGTCATITWQYSSAEPDYAQTRSQVTSILLREFAAHDSKSVQHTLFDMGKAALAAVPAIASITLTMPNLHHLLADLSAFEQDNPNHIFIPIDEPHGYIEATVERD